MPAAPPDTPTAPRTIDRELSILQRASLQLGRSLDLHAVLEECLDLVEELTGAEISAIHVDEGAGDELRIAAFRHHGQGVLFPSLPRAVIEHMPRDRAVVVEDVRDLHEPYRSACERAGLATTLAIPLATDDTVIGLLSIGLKAGAVLSPGTQGTLVAVAELQAAAIDRARTHALAELRARLSDSVRRVAERALAAADTTAIADAILDGLGEVTGLPAGRLSLLDEEGVLWPVRIRGLPAPLSDLGPLLLDDPAVRWLLSLDGPTLVRSVTAAPEGSLYRSLLERTPIAGLMLMPLRRGGRFLGVLAAFATQPLDCHPEEVKALGLLASVAVSALEADRLRREAEAQRRRLGQILDQVPVSLTVTDPAGRLEHANASVRSVTPHLRIGDTWDAVLAGAELTHPDGTPVALDQVVTARALRLEEPAPQELRVRTAAGLRYIVTHAVALRDDDGHLGGVVSTAQDVTALRELADSRDRFLRMATHELSNPLASLQAVVNRMAMEPAALADPERRADYLARLRRQVDRTTRIVHDLHDVERLRDGTLRLVREPIDLAELARETVEPLAAEAPRHAIHVEERAPTTGAWDRVRIAQVVTNLVTNAQRYSPDGGEILVTVEPRGPEALLVVIDHGIGIPPAQQRHLFEPGYRSKEAGRLAPGGSGLGLYITHEIVRRHGGRITVDSEPGHGSRFHVWLPREAGDLARR